MVLLSLVLITELQMLVAKSPQLMQLLLNHAEDVGVTFIDTAQAYGNAEFVLCDALPANHSFRIISKLPPQPIHNSFDSASEACWQRCQATIARMHVRQLDTLLLHSANDLRRQIVIFAPLVAWGAASRLVRRIGVRFIRQMNLSTYHWKICRLFFLVRFMINA